MGSRSVFCALCLLAGLAAVACGNDDDGLPGASAGSSGKGNVGGGGKGNAGANGKAGETAAGADNSGGTAGVDDGAAGAAGAAGQPSAGCTKLSDFVHAVIKEDTTVNSAPRPVNGVVFCDDPADPTAYSDLF
jgi:hypothetical protein